MEIGDKFLWNMDRKGQSDMGGIVTSLISVGLILVIGLYIYSNVYSQMPQASCVDVDERFNVSDSTTTKANGSITYLLTLVNQREQTANLTVVYEWDNATDVYVSGTQLGTLSGTSPDTFTNVTGSWLFDTSPLNVSFLNTTENVDTNITRIDLVYRRQGLEGCDLTRASYDTSQSVNTTVYNSFNLFPIGLIVIAAVFIIATIMLLGGDRR